MDDAAMEKAVRCDALIEERVEHYLLTMLLRGQQGRCVYAPVPEHIFPDGATLPGRGHLRRTLGAVRLYNRPGLGRRQLGDGDRHVSATHFRMNLSSVSRYR